MSIHDHETSKKALGLAFLVLRGTWKVARRSIDKLLKAAPSDINFEEVITLLKGVKGVCDINDLHIWTLSSGMRALSAHVLVDDTMARKCGEISKQLKKILKDEFHINHATLELESKNCPEGMTSKIEKP